MADSPLVSICIPAYNAEAYVRDCLESALNQTYPNIEIICVNDGSTDNTLSILNEYKHCIQVIHGQNQGAPAARNLALSHTKGQFIQFLDADNLMHPQKIELQLPALIKNEADMVFCNKEILYDDGHLQQRPPAPATEGIDPLVYCLRHNVPGKRAAIDTEVPLHRKSTIEKIHGFRLGVMRGQDKDLTYRLAAAGARFKYLDRVLMTYRDHNGPRISHKEKGPGYDMELLMDILQIIQNGPPYQLKVEQQKEFALTLIKLSKKSYRNGNFNAAKVGFNKAQELYSKGDTSESLIYRTLRGLCGYSFAERLRYLVSKLL